MGILTIYLCKQVQYFLLQVQLNSGALPFFEVTEQTEQVQNSQATRYQSYIITTVCKNNSKDDANVLGNMPT